MTTGCTCTDRLCPVCLMGGAEVKGLPDDFAHRCEQHKPYEGPQVVWMSPDLLYRFREFLDKLVELNCKAFAVNPDVLGLLPHEPKRSVYLVDIKDKGVGDA